MEQVAGIEELLTEILVRVPARPLVRFKCVSKHWLSLISDPEFCHRHTLQNPNASVSAVFPWTSASTSTTALSFIPLGDFDHHPKSNYANQTLSGSPNSSNPRNFVPNLHRIIFLQTYRIMFLQSCSGIFLCCPLAFLKIRRYYILNPTTNQFSTLTPPAAAAAAAASSVRILMKEALAFDPSRSPHYNVVVCWTNTTLAAQLVTDFRIELFSSETKSWRLVDSCFSLPISFEYDVSLYCNGAVHWIGLWTPLSYYHIDSGRIGYVNQLVTDASDLRFRFLQESHCGGSFLHLIDTYVSRIEVSEVQRDYSGWCLKYRIDTDRILTTSPRKFAVLFLTTEEVEGDESSSLLLHTPGEVISYNLKRKTSKSFRLTPREGIDDSKLRVGHHNIRYMETLACV